MRKTWMAVGLLSLLALSAHAAKVSPESLIHGPYLLPNAAQLRLAVGGGDGAILYAWTENGRGWVKSSLSANRTLLPSTGNENVRIGGIAYNDGRFLVTWLEGSQALAARVSREGALLDGLPFRLSPAAGDVDVVADPQGFRVFVDQQQNGFGMSRVTTTGQLVDIVPIPIGTGRPHTVIASAERFAWLQASPLGNPAGPRVMSVRFNSRPANDSPSPGVLSLGVGGLSPLPFMEPALASSGSMYLMAYHTGTAIRGARVNADGTPIDTANGFLIAVDAMAPSASPMPVQALWDGSKFLVVWEDMRSDGNIDIKAAYVTTHGGSTWFDIAAGPADERAPALHLLDPGRVLVVYQKVGPLSTEVVSRVVSEKRERAVRR